MLRELQKRLEGLKSRQHASTEIDRFRRYVEVAGVAAEELAEVRRGRNYMLCIFPEALAAGSRKALDDASTRAKAYQSMLTTFDAIDHAKSEREFGELKKLAQRAKGALRTEWDEQIVQVTERYSRIVRALRQAKISGSADLSAAVERVKAKKDPPRSEPEAQRIRADIDAVMAKIRDLGAEGPVGEFLAAVADRHGSAKSLLLLDVSRILDEHGLWNDLAISFR
jgi:hypothetical protein